MYFVKKVTIDENDGILQVEWGIHTALPSAEKDYRDSVDYNEVSLLKTTENVTIVSSVDEGGSYLIGPNREEENVIAEVLRAKYPMDEEDDE